MSFVNWGLAARAAADDEAGAIAVGHQSARGLFYPLALRAMLAAVAGGTVGAGAGRVHAAYVLFRFGRSRCLVTLIVGGMGSSLGALAGLPTTTVLMGVMRRIESAVSIFGLTQSSLALAMILIIWRRPKD